MAGNRSSAATFHQLFGQANFSLGQIVPPHLEVLAARVPGDPSETVQGILRENTLLPLFQPFLGKREQNQASGNLINRLPRHVVGNHGHAYLCFQCLAEATERFGFGYWHRSHQAPGVTACWKHGILLRSSCPHCSLPFQRKNQLLEAPWLPCAQCDHELSREGAVQPASKNEVDYAVFVHNLLAANITPVAPDLLAQLYRQRIQQIGFVRGQVAGSRKHETTSRHMRSTSMTAFTEAFIELLGPDFITRVDPAYATGRTTNWLRFTMVDGVMDMPLQRHILLCLRLFGTPAHFVQAIRSADQQSPAPRAAPNRDDERADVGIRDQHRQRIAREIRIDPAMTLEGLWRRAYRPTAWLFEHDKAWLTATLTSSTQDEPETQLATAEDLLRDREFADKVENYARQLVAKHGKPSRITMQKLLDHLPISYSHLKLRSHKWPKLSEALSRNKESSWSLSARRILWAIGEVQRFDLTLTASNIIARTAVSHYVLQRICQFARWEFEALARQPIHIPVELARAGIGLTWQGPHSSAWTEIGGRAYVATSTRTVNKHVELLRSTAGMQPLSREKSTASLQPEHQEQ